MKKYPWSSSGRKPVGSREPNKPAARAIDNQQQNRKHYLVEQHVAPDEIAVHDFAKSRVETDRRTSRAARAIAFRGSQQQRRRAPVKASGR